MIRERFSDASLAERLASSPHPRDPEADGFVRVVVAAVDVVHRLGDFRGALLYFEHLGARPVQSLVLVRTFNGL